VEMEVEVWLEKEQGKVLSNFSHLLYRLGLNESVGMWWVNPVFEDGSLKGCWRIRRVEWK
jgi:hypothetical protein